MTKQAEQEVKEVGINEADRNRNRRMGAGIVDDPYPTFDRLREQQGVHEGAISDQFGIEDFSLLLYPKDTKYFFAVSWSAVETVFRTPEIYSSSWYKPVLRDIAGYSILEMDAPDHRHNRGLVQPAFKRRAIDDWEHKFLTPKINALVDQILTKDKADLYTELCAIIPVHTIVCAFGIPAEEAGQFHERVTTATGGAGSLEERFEAIQWVASRLKEIIAERRNEPKDDLLSMLASITYVDEEDGSSHTLDDDEILAFARVMLPAGAGTTYRGLGTLLLALLNDREQFDALINDRSLLDQAIEEVLRWEPPLPVLGRYVLEDTVLEGMVIPKGSIMQMCIGAANHDPSRWNNPGKFDIFRAKKAHISFGSGPHTCIGLHLARMEMRAVLNAIMDKMPNISLDPAAETPYMTGLTFRMPTAVPVLIEKS